MHHERVSDHARSLIAATAHIADEKVSAAREKLQDVMETATDAIEYVEERAVETISSVRSRIRPSAWPSALAH